MKILLPKTLAEPLTIWPTRYLDYDFIDITRTLQDYFEYLEREGITPGLVKTNKSISITAINSVLRHSAVNNGATGASSEACQLPSRTDLTAFIGYRYIVRFKVDGNDKIHTVVLDSYFK